MPPGRPCLGRFCPGQSHREGASRGEREAQVTRLGGDSNRVGEGVGLMVGIRVPGGHAPTGTGRAPWETVGCVWKGGHYGSRATVWFLGNTPAGNGSSDNGCRGGFVSFWDWPRGMHLWGSHSRESMMCFWKDVLFCRRPSSDPSSATRPPFPTEGHLNMAENRTADSSISY
ncbi:hypothetical protein CRENBAI_008519 [Crenichthys baileyi]|uniref:Uncharacterized protein n=1 Tax=Crenichthys baileyi TaxID=28760 RepID=A0AAV9SEL7_9TELE